MFDMRDGFPVLGARKKDISGDASASVRFPAMISSMFTDMKLSDSKIKAGESNAFIDEFGGRVSGLKLVEIKYIVNTIELRDDLSCYIEFSTAPGSFSSFKWRGHRNLPMYVYDKFNGQVVIEIRGIDKLDPDGKGPIEFIFRLELTKEDVFDFCGISLNSEDKESRVENWKLASVVQNWAKSRLNNQVVTFKDPRDIPDRNPNDQEANIVIRTNEGNILFLPDVDRRDKILETFRETFDPETSTFDEDIQILPRDIIYWNAKVSKLMYVSGDGNLITHPLDAFSEYTKEALYVTLNYRLDIILFNVIYAEKKAWNGYKENPLSTFTKPFGEALSLVNNAALVEFNTAVRVSRITTIRDLVASFENSHGVAGARKIFQQMFDKLIEYTPNHPVKNPLTRYSIAGLCFLCADLVGKIKSLDEEIDKRIADMESATVDDLQSLPDNISPDMYLLPHQGVAMAELQKGLNYSDNAALAAATGGGKTPMFTLLALHAMANKDIKKPLYITTKALVANTYNEIATKFCRDKMNCIVIETDTVNKYGIDELGKLVKNAPPNTIFVTTYSWIKGTKGIDHQVENIGKRKIYYFSNVEWLIAHGIDAIFCDESQKAKTEKTPTHKAVRQLSSRVKLRSIGSGTLMPNAVEDLAGQSALLDPGIFYSAKAMKLMFKDEGAVLSKQAIDRLYRLMKLMGATVKTRKDWFYLLPKIKESFHKVTLSESQLQVYKALVKNEIDDLLSSDKLNKNVKEWLESDDTDKDMPPELIARLKRIDAFASDPASSEFADQTHGILRGEDLESPKLPLILDIIEKHFQKTPNEKLLILTQHAARVVKYVYNRLGKWQKQTVLYTAGNKQVLSRFQYDDNVKILIGCDASLKEGMNLQVASRMIRLDIHLTPGDMDQVIARIYRPSGPGDLLKTFLEENDKKDYKLMIGRMCRTTQDDHGKILKIEGNKVTIDTGEKKITANPKDVWVKADTREFVTIDWIVCDKTIDVIKFRRVIRKMVQTAAAQKIIAADAIEFKPLIKITKERLLGDAHFDEALEDDIPDYRRFRELEEEAWLEMREKMNLNPILVPRKEAIPGELIKVPLPPGAIVPGIRTASEAMVELDYDDPKQLIGHRVETEFGPGTIVSVKVDYDIPKKDEDDKDSGEEITNVTEVIRLSIRFDDGVSRPPQHESLIDVLDERDSGEGKPPVPAEDREGARVEKIGGKWYHISEDGIISKIKKNGKVGAEWAVFDFDMNCWTTPTGRRIGKKKISDELDEKLRGILTDLGYELPEAEEDEVDEVKSKPIVIRGEKLLLLEDGTIVPRDTKRDGTFKKPKLVFEPKNEDWTTPAGRKANLTPKMKEKITQLLYDLGYKRQIKETKAEKILHSSLVKLKLPGKRAKQSKYIILTADGKLYYSEDESLDDAVEFAKFKKGEWKLNDDAPTNLTTKTLDALTARLMYEKKGKTPKQAEEEAETEEYDSYWFKIKKYGKIKTYIMQRDGSIHTYNEKTEKVGKKVWKYDEGSWWTIGGESADLSEVVVNKLSEELAELNPKIVDKKVEKPKKSKKPKLGEKEGKQSKTEKEVPMYAEIVPVSFAGYPALTISNPPEVDDIVGRALKTGKYAKLNLYEVKITPQRIKQVLPIIEKLKYKHYDEIEYITEARKGKTLKKMPKLWENIRANIIRYLKKNWKNLKELIVIPICYANNDLYLWIIETEPKLLKAVKADLEKFFTYKTKMVRVSNTTTVFKQSFDFTLSNLRAAKLKIANVGKTRKDVNEIAKIK